MCFSTVNFYITRSHQGISIICMVHNTLCKRIDSIVQQVHSLHYLMVIKRVIQHSQEFHWCTHSFIGQNLLLHDVDQANLLLLVDKDPSEEIENN